MNAKHLIAVAALLTASGAAFSDTASPTIPVTQARAQTPQAAMDHATASADSKSSGINTGDASMPGPKAIETRLYAGS